MRIGIEAQRIFRKKKHGMDLVILELLLQLQNLPTQHHFYVFVNEDEDTEVLQPSDNLSIIKLPKSPYPIWEQYHLPRAVKQYKIDLLHTTSNTAPIFTSIPLLITLHDIIYMEKIDLKNGTWYQRFGNVYRRWNVPIVAKKAKHLITVSGFEKERIDAFFKFSPEKVIVVHNGVRPHFNPVAPAEARVALENYNLPEEFILFLGNTDPKKNLKNVLLAFQSFLQETNSSIKMVMPDFGEDNLTNLLDSLNASEIRKNIFLTGYIQNEILPNIYSLAKFFMYPSLRESFGLPILEAMACGCPVITSDTSSMPEVAGKAALLVDPRDITDIKNSMLKVNNDVEIREKLISAGIERAAEFSYTKAAEKLLRIYDSMI